jgi:ribonuclease HI
MTHTTNNRMEIMAVLQTLKYFKECSDLIIISDSQYVVNSIVTGSAVK